MQILFSFQKLYLSIHLYMCLLLPLVVLLNLVESILDRTERSKHFVYMRAVVFSSPLLWQSRYSVHLLRAL